jgi:hypothetical protein
LKKVKYAQKEVAKKNLLAKSKFWAAAKFAFCLRFLVDGLANP